MIRFLPGFAACVALVGLSGYAWAHPRPGQPDHDAAARRAAATALESVARTSAAQGDNVSLSVVDERGVETGCVVTLTDDASTIEVFKGNGAAFARLAPGRYRVEITKGLEYRPVSTAIDVPASGAVTLTESLRPVAGMPRLGWWSGDVHVHRDRPDADADAGLMALAQSNDLHVMNFLEMGDSGSLEYPQYAYGPPGQVSSDDYWLVSGQEDPRNGFLGHIIILNADGLIRDVDNYFLYEPLFDAAHDQGALVGYAHFYNAFFMGMQELGPFSRPRPGHNLFIFNGFIDFIEVINGDNPFDPLLYFEILNFGLEMPLAAGSDTPFGGAQLGTDYSYVHIGEGEALTPQKWFDGLEAGRTFFTEGPLIEAFTVNGEMIGSTLDVEAGAEIEIRATVVGAEGLGASPQLIEVIAFGETIFDATSDDPAVESLSLTETLTVERSTWLVLRVRSHDGLSTLTSPIYAKVCNNATLAPVATLEPIVADRLMRLEELRGRINEIPAGQQDTILGQITDAENTLMDFLIEPELEECPDDTGGEDSTTSASTSGGTSGGSSGAEAGEAAGAEAATAEAEAGSGTQPSGESGGNDSGGANTDSGCGCRTNSSPASLFWFFALLCARRHRGVPIVRLRRNP